MSGHAVAEAQKQNSAPVKSGVLQRKTCSCGRPITANGECAECRKKRMSLQRRAVNQAGPKVAPPIVHEVLRSPGRPLEQSTRTFMENQFNKDFSSVRVHTDNKATASARAVNARAYTVGENIVFQKGQYIPGSHKGQRLLAHELTHVLQQRKNQTAMQHASLAISKRNCPKEREADQIAETVIRNNTITSPKLNGELSASSRLLQRTIGDSHDLQSPRFSGDLVLEACFDDERTLSYGSEGPAVEKIQQALIDAGFALPVFGVDGIFKSETAGALRDYQRANGLDPDGIVGPLTMGSLDTRFAAPAPPGPAPAPPGPAPAPPGPAPSPPETITSQTVATSPGARTRTDIGVGEEVRLTHAPGSATWTTTAGTLSAASGVTVILTAPDTAQRLTVRAGGASIDFDVRAPTGVHMDRRSGSNIKHHVGRPDSGMLTDVFLLPDTVNFLNVRYRELDVAGTATPGVYSCNPASGGHCSGAVAGACPDKALTNTVVAGKGTKSVLGDCIYSGDCGTAPPFAPGSVTINIPYEYKVGTGAFHRFATATHLSRLLPLSVLISSKAGASVVTSVSAPTTLIPSCP